MMQRYIRFDWALKRLLRNKADYKILEGFLSVLLNNDITIVSILESESNKKNGDDKFNRVDVLAQDVDGTKIIIEIQNDHQLDYFHRILYGTSKVITESIKSGEIYGAIKKIYSISIVYFALGVGDDYVYHGTTEFHGIHTDSILHFTPHQKMVFQGETVGDIYPEYYLLKVDNFDKEAETPLDEWIYFLKTGEISSDATAKGLSEARKQWQYCRLSPEEQAEYESHIETLRYQNSVLWSNHFIGKEEGLKEGKTEGLKIGLSKGIEIGKKEAMIETARRMKSEGIDIDLILKVTGLTTDDIG